MGLRLCSSQHLPLCHVRNVNEMYFNNDLLVLINLYYRNSIIIIEFVLLVVSLQAFQ